MLNYVSHARNELLQKLFIESDHEDIDTEYDESDASLAVIASECAGSEEDDAVEVTNNGVTDEWSNHNL
uniref:Transposase n=1 Tax=Angiostrongylus cantonensis TaxID=6313 RepID=A0A0K0DN28_ANGCA